MCLVTQELKIKTAFRLLLTLVRMAVIKNTVKEKQVRARIKRKRNLLH